MSTAQNNTNTHGSTPRGPVWLPAGEVPLSTGAAPRAVMGLPVILAKRGALAPEKIAQAQERARLQKIPLAQVLKELKLVEPEALARALAEEAGVEFADLAAQPPGADCAHALKEDEALRFGACAFGRDFVTGMWKIAISDPMDPIALRSISKAVGQKFKAYGGSEPAIRSAIGRIYSKGDAIGALAQELRREVADVSIGGPIEDEDSSVAKLLQTIFDDAVAKRASDIHVEPFPEKLLIRIRVDGELILLHTGPATIAAPVVQRLKIMAELDIGERRLPCDGRFTFTSRGRKVDARIATAPVQGGAESAVIRLLSGDSGIPTLDELGFEEEDREEFMRALGASNGMILLTGPTGSGKSTTLYSALGRLNTINSKIITIEDPVEARIPGVIQEQVHEKIGLGFPTLLRSALRQDPDVILLGEMRDMETAETGMRAALTGHLVLSTLHTNDAKSAPMRLEDMGADRFIVASTLRLVVAQRLVRMACPRCAEAVPIDARSRLWLEKAFDGKPVPAGTPVHGAGCPACSGTGYLGRRAIHECLTFDDELVDILHHGTRREYSAACDQRLSGRRLAAKAAMLALRGKTSIAEAQKATGGSF